MKTKSVFFSCLLAFALLCIQCHSHGNNTASDVSSEATETISDKAEAAKEAVQATAAPVAQVVKEEMKEAAPKLTKIKEEVKEKATLVKEEAADAVKKVKEEVKEVAVKKEEASKPKPKKKKKKARPAIKFEELSYEFGKIKQGEVIKHDFKFKNTGKAPLVIKKVDVSCGCTFPSYPFIPIEPGKEGTIGITYDSKNKAGRQKPTITVVTNGSPRTLKLHLEGYVE